MTSHDLFDDDPWCPDECDRTRIPHVSRTVDDKVVERERLAHGILAREMFRHFLCELPDDRTILRIERSFLDEANSLRRPSIRKG